MKTMQDYTCYCTEEQTRRAYALGAPIEKNYCETLNQTTSFSVDDMYLVIPTTQQMANWLRDKGVGIKVGMYGINTYEFAVAKNNSDLTIAASVIFDTYEEAELAAIDAALDYGEEVVFK